MTDDAGKFINPNLSIQQAESAVLAANPDARLVRIWMGDSWPAGDTERLRLAFLQQGVQLIRMIPNPGADSLLEFSDGHFVVARTDEQSAGNSPPNFGKARRDAYASGRGTGTGGERDGIARTGGKRKSKRR